MLLTFWIASQAIPCAAQSTLPPVESADGATRARWLVDGLVVDSETGKPIKTFSVTPGTMSRDSEGRTVIRWRENLLRKMTDGQLRWPRTSGFSVMRFRVTAPGYQPAVTQKIYRGGPHSRVRIKMNPITPDPNAESSGQRDPG